MLFVFAIMENWVALAKCLKTAEWAGVTRNTYTFNSCLPLFLFFCKLLILSGSPLCQLRVGGPSEKVITLKLHL